MAHVYTTARGKTKKAKETQRKDAKNNAANKLMSNIVRAAPRAQAYTPLNLDFMNKPADVNGMKTLEGNTKSKLFRPEHLSTNNPNVTDETLAKAIRNIRVQLPSYHRCFYSLCASPSETSTYKHCSKCRIARYCSPECQKLDWPRIHKYACGKSDILTVETSVAIRPIDTYISLIPSSLYPSETCKAPCNEFHGVITAVQTTPSTDPSSSDPIPVTVDIEIFDCNVIPTSTKLTVPVADVVATGWELELERGLADQKAKSIEEARKRAEDRKAMIEEEERKYQEKKRVKEERVKALVEKKKQELEKASGSVGVDWSVFESELMDTIEDLPEDE